MGGKTEYKLGESLADKRVAFRGLCRTQLEGGNAATGLFASSTRQVRVTVAANVLISESCRTNAPQVWTLTEDYAEVNWANSAASLRATSTATEAFSP